MPGKSRDRTKDIEKQKLLLKTEKGFLHAKKSLIKNDNENENERASTSESKKKQKTTTLDISQRDIANSVDITNASKHFELNLDKLGPYKCNYFKSGRFLLLGGSMGHVAALDWVTKDLLCEFNVRETVHAVQWLHIPNMFAVAQKNWVHLYDKDGIELNVIKTMYRISHLDFLEHHFLLTSASDKNYITWKDISVGKDVASFPSKNKITHLTHNQQNGLLFCSHHNGTVSMWSPNYNRPAVSILCHPAPVRRSTVSIDGKYFATTSVDKTIKVWDLRNNYQCLKEHKVNHIPDAIHFSQLGLLAVGCGKVVNIYKDATLVGEKLKPYLRHNVENLISDLYFTNYEDVLGIGHQAGFSSILVPGSGEPNFDSNEANPFISKKQQQELEVRMLLDKIPPEMICLDSTRTTV